MDVGIYDRKTGKLISIRDESAVAVKFYNKAGRDTFAKKILSKTSKLMYWACGVTFSSVVLVVVCYVGLEEVAEKKTNNKPRKNSNGMNIPSTVSEYRMSFYGFLGPVHHTEIDEIDVFSGSPIRPRRAGTYQGYANSEFGRVPTIGEMRPFEPEANVSAPEDIQRSDHPKGEYDLQRNLLPEPKVTEPDSGVP